MKTIATFLDGHEAHMARGLLESRGIPAVVADENNASLDSHAPFGLDGVRLQVPEGLAAQAQAILADLDARTDAGADAGFEDPTGYETSGDTLYASDPGGVAAGLSSLRTCRHCGLLVGKPERSRLKYAFKLLLAAFLPIRLEDDELEAKCRACGKSLDPAQDL